MFISTYVSSITDLEACQAAKQVEEVLIESQSFSRLGQLSLQEALQLAHRAQDLLLRPVLVWDILMSEDTFSDTVQLLNEIDISQFSAIRVADCGALQWLLERSSHQPEAQPAPHFMLENCSHNLESLKAWCNYLEQYSQHQQARLILSSQLSDLKICDYCHKLGTPLEVLGAGPIQLAYSPRHLIDPRLPNLSDTRNGLVVANMQEQANLPCRAVQSAHGSFLFLDRDQYLLDQTQQLAEAGLAALTVDLRLYSQGADSATGIKTYCSVNAIVHWPAPCFAGFFDESLTTDELLLTDSPLYQARNDNLLAKVVAAEKDLYTAFFSVREFNPQQTLKVLLTTGEEKCLNGISFSDASHQPLEHCPADTLLLCPWLGKVTPGALLF